MTARRPRRLLKWTVAAVLLVVWSAFVFGLGIEMHEQQMVVTRSTPGSPSYRFGSTGYKFGWHDGFRRGYARGVARAQVQAKVASTDPPSDDVMFADYEEPPEWVTALAAHEAGLQVVRGVIGLQPAAFAKPTR